MAELTPQAKRALLNKKNVVGVGLGCKRIRGQKTDDRAIVVFVKKKERKNNLQARDLVPQELEGTPTDVIEVGEITLLASRTARHRPAFPGISIGHHRVSAGTFGAVVKDKRSGIPLILSNNHVLANMEGDNRGRARIGDPIVQPGTYDGGRVPNDVIGYLHRFVELRTERRPSTCGVAGMMERVGNFVLRTMFPQYEMRFLRKSNVTNLVDAAVAKPVGPELITANILDLGVPQGVAEGVVGQKIYKSGRSSGLTQGEILAVHVDINVNMGEIGTAQFSDQIMATAMSQPGDSGSLVLDEQKRAIGLLFAGSSQATVINRIENVLRLLDITF
ncbi:MAG: hypothetical protein ACOYD6_08935 [Limnochordia bacterium]|jgi:hypothetical protein